ncbi:MAG: hypothetical protein ACWGON_08770, partial [Gemmatimonadota bacterium]
ADCGATSGDPAGSAPPGARIWQRRLVLGPAPEFCIELPGRAEEETPGTDLLTVRRSIIF